MPGRDKENGYKKILEPEQGDSVTREYYIKENYKISMKRIWYELSLDFENES